MPSRTARRAARVYSRAIRAGSDAAARREGRGRSSTASRSSWRPERKSTTWPRRRSWRRSVAGSAAGPLARRRAAGRAGGRGSGRGWRAGRPASACPRGTGPAATPAVRPGRPWGATARMAASVRKDFTWILRSGAGPHVRARDRRGRRAPRSDRGRSGAAPGATHPSRWRHGHPRMRRRVATDTSMQAADAPRDKCAFVMTWAAGTCYRRRLRPMRMRFLAGAQVDPGTRLSSRVTGSGRRGRKDPPGPIPPGVGQPRPVRLVRYLGERRRRRPSRPPRRPSAARSRAPRCPRTSDRSRRRSATRARRPCCGPTSAASTTPCCTPRGRPRGRPPRPPGR